MKLPQVFEQQGLQSDWSPMPHRGLP